jgi:uncharacterized coiled-coil protein SlyX
MLEVMLVSMIVLVASTVNTAQEQRLVAIEDRIEMQEDWLYDLSGQVAAGQASNKIVDEQQQKQIDLLLK